VVKQGEFEYTIELALAGFTREDVTIELKDHVLTITGERKQRREQDVYIHHGISTRKFVKSYRLSEYTEVTGADLKDGILSVNLAVRLPEEQKPKLIKIGS
jgi:molecular chaperone IbpA